VFGTVNTKEKKKKKGGKRGKNPLARKGPGKTLKLGRTPCWTKKVQPKKKECGSKEKAGGKNRGEQWDNQVM